MKKFGLLCYILLSCLTAAAEKEVLIRLGEDIYTLNEFSGKPDPNHHHFGEYVFSNEFHGGTKLHLFPNGSFVISEWLDVAPDTLRAAGTYKLRKDCLTLQFTRISKGHEELKTFFSDLHLFWGWIEKEDAVSGFEVLIFSGKELEKLKDGPDMRPFFMSRQTEYTDWEQILRNYTNQKK